MKRNIAATLLVLTLALALLTGCAAPAAPAVSTAPAASAAPVASAASAVSAAPVIPDSSAVSAAPAAEAAPIAQPEAVSSATPVANPAPAASSASITEAEAKAIALKHAGVAESEATFVRVQLDKDDGRLEYEIEFYKGNTEYDYDVDAQTGKILSYDSEAEHYTPSTAANSSAGGSTGNSGSAGGTASGSDIGKAEAKRIALSHAGLAESAVSKMRVESDMDDGRAEYEVEFHVGQTEYSYDIDAASGSILSVDIDKD